MCFSIYEIIPVVGCTLFSLISCSQMSNGNVKLVGNNVLISLAVVWYLYLMRLHNNQKHKKVAWVNFCSHVIGVFLAGNDIVSMLMFLKKLIYVKIINHLGLSFVFRFCFTCIDNWATITNLCPLCQNEFQLITCVPVSIKLLELCLLCLVIPSLELHHHPLVQLILDGLLPL